MKGLTQIPLVLVLAIMVLSLPLALRLVGQNQDNRNFAEEKYVMNTEMGYLEGEEDEEERCGLWNSGRDCFCLLDLQCKRGNCEDWACE